jgi:hypothetical protein
MKKMSDYKNCVTGNPEMVSLWRRICDEADEQERQWIANLRAAGFKAAHPNDGWVDRGKNEVYLAYPQFNDGAEIGDLVMIGWPYKSSRPRPVRIVGKREWLGGVYWRFEDVETLD